MAESFAFDIAHSVLGKLASSAYEEASRAYGVYDDLQRFKDTLSILKGLLLDAEQKKNQNHALFEWLRQIRNICSDAEDVLDGFECQRLRKQVVTSCGSTSMKVGHFFSSHNPLVSRFRMAHQIKDVRDRLDKVAADGTKFGLVRIDVDHRLVGQRREMTHSHVDASDVIGRENDREEIVQLLMQPHSDGDKSLCVIPMVGIGGMGKTTLAKLVFNDKRMDELFQLKMWVCVSDDFDIKQIIIKIINSASAPAPAPGIALSHQENITHLDIEQLQSRLRYKLSGQKFLLVLDDIWNEDRAKWIELANLLKVGAAGSKILVTTRNTLIASMMGTVPSSYDLEGLSPEDCLSLFVKWAFKEGEEKKYPDLVEVGKEIVKKCCGVPLAVRTLGSSLFKKIDIEKWEFVRDNEIWNLKQKRDEILPALKLSYDQMPSHLRHCFACFSLFPKGFLFFQETVSNLWLAVGLLQFPHGSEKQENIAREYIDELHSRSFLQDFIEYGHSCSFKVHDLVHDLARYVATEVFLMVASRTQNVPEQVRHLSIVEHDSIGYALFHKSTRVRTILFPFGGGKGFDSKTVLDTWVSRYKYLRYLDLSESSLETLPNSIGKLEHLRVLDLSNNRKIKRLPGSICKLQNLQVLKLVGCMELEALPKGLGKLISLRKLVITTKQSVLSENEFASLSNLDTLGFFNCDNLKYLFSGAQLTALEALWVVSCGSLETLPLYNLPKLETLWVRDCEKLQLSMNHEIPIERLRMKHLYLAEYPRLQALPGWIEGAADTLQTLLIAEFPVLEMLPEWLTTMTHLKTLTIASCPQLLSLPSDMHRLTALEELLIGDCPELVRKYQPKSGEYWPIIAHIKRVEIGQPGGEEEGQGRLEPSVQDEEAATTP